MNFGEQSVAASLPIWLRTSYSRALDVYSVLLGHTQIGFSYDGSGSPMPSFLFSLDAIFEGYIRNTFRTALAGDSLSVVDGNATAHQAPLFIDTKRFLIKPDVIFRRNNEVRGVGEVKYKPKISEADRYQVISHVLATGAPFGIWISPTVEGASTIDYVGAIGTGAKFFHYKLNISANLEEASTAMVRDIAELLA